MNKAKKKYGLASYMIGAVAGFIAGSVVSAWIGKNSRSTAQQRRNKAMDAVLEKVRNSGVIPLKKSHSYIIFSDLHKGAKDQADEFRYCEDTYLAALDYYHDKGYRLVVLGDAEEQWENTVSIVFKNYQNVFKSEGRFYPERYIRIYGNHDNGWKIESLVRKYLFKYFPNINVRPGVLFKYKYEGDKVGELFLVHGHQGTLTSDTFDFIPPFVLPLYRIFQNLTNLGHYSPSKDACMQSLHDSQMYQWASSKKNLILITGHTHRPVWSSSTHLDKLIKDLHLLQQENEKSKAKENSRSIDKLFMAIQTRAEKNPPCDGSLKTRPCYFNSGCCCYKDGDITGIEIVNGKMNLVRWCKGNCDKPGEETGYIRSVLEKQPLEELFKELDAAQEI